MDYRFSDLLDIPDLQRTLVSFHAASGIPAEIMDLESRRILASSNSEIIEDYHVLTLELGRGEEQTLSSNNAKPLRRYKYHGRLFRYARVIQVENHEIADVLLGPVIHEPLSGAASHELALKLGSDGAQSKALEQIPVVTEAQIYHHV